MLSRAGAKENLERIFDKKAGKIKLIRLYSREIRISRRRGM